MHGNDTVRSAWMRLVQLFADNEEIGCGAAQSRQEHEGKTNDGGRALNASLRQHFGGVVGRSIALHNIVAVIRGDGGGVIVVVVGRGLRLRGRRGGGLSGRLRKEQEWALQRGPGSVPQRERGWAQRLRRPCRQR